MVRKRQFKKKLCVLFWISFRFLKHRISQQVQG